MRTIGPPGRKFGRPFFVLRLYLRSAQERKQMNCKCGVTIPVVRLEYGYTCCVNCSTEEKRVCFMVYGHKTGGELIAVDAANKEAVRQARRANERAR